MENKIYYVEKYADEVGYMNGDMTSCKKFFDYDRACKYFEAKSLQYKHGYLLFTEYDENNEFLQIIDETAFD